MVVNFMDMFLVFSAKDSEEWMVLPVTPIVVVTPLMVFKMCCL